jgi:hypothetical protein
MAGCLSRLIAELDGDIAMSGEKQFIEAVVQEKGHRFYVCLLACKASDGVKWNLTGSGETVVQATEIAWQNFKRSEDEWDLHGHPID